MSGDQNNSPTWADLNDFERPKLIHAAIYGGLRMLTDNRRVCRLADKGLLVSVTTSYSGTYTTYALTQAGRDIVLSCPDDYQRKGFPRLDDVQKAKAILRTSSQQNVK